MKDIASANKSLEMKLDNAKKAKLSPAAFVAYIEGKVKLCRAEKLVKSGYRVKEPSVYLPIKSKKLDVIKSES